MGRPKEIVRKELLELEAGERAEVAEDALRSLAETGYGELSPACDNEIQRRLEFIDDGSVVLVNADQVLKDLEEELRTRRGRS